MLHGLKIFSRFQIDLFPFGELHITSSTDINPTSQPSFYFKLPLFLILILLIFFLEEPWHKASSMPLRQKKKNSASEHWCSVQFMPLKVIQLEKKSNLWVCNDIHKNASTASTWLHMWFTSQQWFRLYSIDQMSPVSLSPTYCSFPQYLKLESALLHIHRKSNQSTWCYQRLRMSAEETGKDVHGRDEMEV